MTIFYAFLFFYLRFYFLFVWSNCLLMPCTPLVGFFVFFLFLFLDVGSLQWFELFVFEIFSTVYVCVCLFHFLSYHISYCISPSPLGFSNPKFPRCFVIFVFFCNWFYFFHSYDIPIPRIPLCRCLSGENILLYQIDGFSLFFIHFHYFFFSVLLLHGTSFLLVKEILGNGGGGIRRLFFIFGMFLCFCKLKQL